MTGWAVSTLAVHVHWLLDHVLNSSGSMACWGNPWCMPFCAVGRVCETSRLSWEHQGGASPSALAGMRCSWPSGCRHAVLMTSFLLHCSRGTAVQVRERGA